MLSDVGLSYISRLHLGATVQRKTANNQEVTSRIKVLKNNKTLTNHKT